MNDQNNQNNLNLINNKYILISVIGSGSFGTIYKGQNIRTKELVAIKVEPIKKEIKLLKNESNIYQYLKNTIGIPQVKWFGKDTRNYYMVINLLGESLQQLKDKTNILSLRLTLQIGIQILYLLKTIHDKGLVHRDIKPDNFLLGLHSLSKQIYLIDFGFCKTYLNNESHIEIKKINNIIGSLTYTSINSHNFLEQSRRDDLESLGYMLIYLNTGNLEWQNISITNSFEEKNRIIRYMKQEIIHNTNIPSILLYYLKCVRSLEFDETPNYINFIDYFKLEIETINSSL